HIEKESGSRNGGIDGVVARDAPVWLNCAFSVSPVVECFAHQLRRVFEGVTDLPTPTSLSDHRISQLYHISEAEKKVIDEIKKIKEQREADSAADYASVKEGSGDIHNDFNRSSGPQKSVKIDGPGSELSDVSSPENEIERDVSFRDHDVSITMVTSALPAFRSSVCFIFSNCVILIVALVTLS
ncbi:hypothetical protein KIN20_000043, partial [Parelaphostrongylus tenuis]